MSAVFEFELSAKNTRGEDTLHINSQKTKITGYVNVLKFIDNDTKQYVSYAPAFCLSGYGETDEKALEMLKTSLSDFFNDLSEMSTRQIHETLSDLGWKKDRLRNKDFSKVFVDEDGNLNNLNAEAGKVERVALVA